MKLDFGHLALDLKTVIKFLKQDFKDDWFKDPILFKDRFNYESILNYFDENINTNAGVFKPVKRKLLNVPKKGSTLRYSLETCFYDRIAYHAFGIVLIPYFDSLISRRVFNHRFDIKSFSAKSKDFLFLNSINQWKKFEAFVRLDAENKSILVVDLLNYFENIDISILKRTLMNCLQKTECSAREKSHLNFCIQSLCNCLSDWAYDLNKGLPQSRDISSFLANIYMLPVDEEMLRMGFDYYRYMDDIKLICNDKFEARKALKTLIVKLREIGLSVNPRKTEIIEPGSEKHNIFLKHDSVHLEVIDSMLQSKKKPLVAFAFLKIKDGLEKILTTEDRQSAEFRFYVNRICKIALCKDIAKPEGFFDAITEGILGSFIDAPEAMDQYYLYLTAIKLKENDLNKIQSFILDLKVCIYSWQNYLIWKILAYHHYCTKDLVSHAKKILREDSANAAGAILYLGKCGCLEDKIKIAEHFKEMNNFFHQRHALIGLQEVDYQIIKEFISPYILRESVGIYRSLKELNEPSYISPPDPIPYKQLINEISFYA
ncbi:MAG: RNA-directed DNA polymerase [Candidatus Omnitrophota bacterium]